MQELIDQGVKFEEFAMPSSPDTSDADEAPGSDGFSAPQLSRALSGSQGSTAPHHTRTPSVDSSLARAHSWALSDDQGAASPADGHVIDLPGQGSLSSRQGPRRSRSMRRSKSKRLGNERRYPVQMEHGADGASGVASASKRWSLKCLSSTIL